MCALVLAREGLQEIKSGYVLAECAEVGLVHRGSWEWRAASG